MNIISNCHHSVSPVVSVPLHWTWENAEKVPDRSCMELFFLSTKGLWLVWVTTIQGHLYMFQVFSEVMLASKAPRRSVLQNTLHFAKLEISGGYVPLGSWSLSMVTTQHPHFTMAFFVLYSYAVTLPKYLWELIIFKNHFLLEDGFPSPLMTHAGHRSKTSRKWD